MNDIVQGLSPAECRAVAIVALMIRLHGGPEGDGLFTGVARYSVLQGRVKMAAETSRDVRMMWDRATARMGWSITATDHDAAVLTLIRPSETDPDVLRALADRSDSIVRLSRQIARRDRAKKRGEALPDFPVYDDPLDVFLALDAKGEPSTAAAGPISHSPGTSS